MCWVKLIALSYFLLSLNITVFRVVLDAVSEPIFIAAALYCFAYLANTPTGRKFEKLIMTLRERASTETLLFKNEFSVNNLYTAYKKNCWLYLTYDRFMLRVVERNGGLPPRYTYIRNIETFTFLHKYLRPDVNARPLAHQWPEYAVLSFMFLNCFLYCFFDDYVPGNVLSQVVTESFFKFEYMITYTLWLPYLTFFYFWNFKSPTECIANVYEISCTWYYEKDLDHTYIDFILMLHEVVAVLDLALPTGTSFYITKVRRPTGALYKTRELATLEDATRVVNSFFCRFFYTGGFYFSAAIRYLYVVMYLGTLFCTPLASAFYVVFVWSSADSFVYKAVNSFYNLDYAFVVNTKLFSFEFFIFVFSTITLFYAKHTSLRVSKALNARTTLSVADVRALKFFSNFLGFIKFMRISILTYVILACFYYYYSITQLLDLCFLHKLRANQFASDYAISKTHVPNLYRVPVKDRPTLFLSILQGDLTPNWYSTPVVLITKLVTTVLFYFYLSFYYTYYYLLYLSKDLYISARPKSYRLEYRVRLLEVIVIPTPEFIFLSMSSLVFSLVLLSADCFLVSILCLECLTIVVCYAIAINFNTKSVESAVRYFLVSAIASAVMLYALSLTYGLFATVDMNDLLQCLLNGVDAEYICLVQYIYCLFFFCFTVKSGLFPFNFWLLDAYSGCNLPTLFVLSTFIKFVLVSFFIKIFFLTGFFPYRAIAADFVFYTATCSIIASSFLLSYETDIRKFVAYSSVNHTAYFLLCVYCQNFTVANLSIFMYGVSYATAVILFFYVLSKFSAIYRITTVADLRIVQLDMVDRIMLSASVLSMAGLPPFFGFFSKFLVLSTIATYSDASYVVATLLFFSVFSYVGYFRVIRVLWFSDNFSTKSNFLRNREKMDLGAFYNKVITTFKEDPYFFIDDNKFESKYVTLYRIFLKRFNYILAVTDNAIRYALLFINTFGFFSFTLFFKVFLLTFSTKSARFAGDDVSSTVWSLPRGCVRILEPIIGQLTAELSALQVTFLFMIACAALGHLLFTLFFSNVNPSLGSTKVITVFGKSYQLDGLNTLVNYLFAAVVLFHLYFGTPGSM